MIFITVGTQSFQLNRLLQQVDVLIEQGKIQEPVYAQIGQGDYIPKHYKYSHFMQPNEFERKVQESDLIIAHSGVGSILCGKKYNKPVIVFPRNSVYGEHIDNHQIQIAEAFQNMDFVAVCRDESRLEEAIQYAKSHSFARYQSNGKNAAMKLKEILIQKKILQEQKS